VSLSLVVEAGSRRSVEAALGCVDVALAGSHREGSADNRITDHGEPDDPRTFGNRPATRSLRCG